MSVSENNSITLLKTVSTTFNCLNISTTSDDTFLISTVDHPRPVRTIDVDGNEGDIQHELLPDKSYKIDKSACTYIPSTKTLVFLDTELHKVYICDTTSGAGHLIKNDKIKNPRYICAGPSCSTFVCCENPPCLVQLSLRGNVLTSHDVDISYPRAVCVSKDGTQIAVSNSDTGCRMLRVFRIK